MGSVAENQEYYARFPWTKTGEEWSAPWGGTWPMWQSSLFPRIHRYLPVNHLLEIGCGRGRIARLLFPWCKQLSLVDLNADCVKTCADRFINTTRVDVSLNNGLSLSHIDDNRIDLAVSFYSLVAADASTMASYLSELSRVLSVDGVAFLHHSNVKHCLDSSTVCEKSRKLLSVYRDPTVDATTVATMAATNNLVCIQQECISWDIRQILTDCFSTIVRADSRHALELKNSVLPVTDNYDFVLERDLATAMYKKHSRGSQRRFSNGKR